MKLLNQNEKTDEDLPEIKLKIAEADQVSKKSRRSQTVLK
jgi:hypothetical protein